MRSIKAASRVALAQDEDQRGGGRGKLRTPPVEGRKEGKISNASDAAQRHILAGHRHDCLDFSFKEFNSFHFAVFFNVTVHYAYGKGKYLVKTT